MKINFLLHFGSLSLVSKNCVSLHLNKKNKIFIKKGENFVKLYTNEHKPYKQANPILLSQKLSLAEQIAPYDFLFSKFFKKELISFL